MIPFDQINAAALANFSTLLADWFPHGVLRGHEFVIGDLRGSPGESLSVNVNTAKWADFASDAKGGDPISLCAAAFHGGDRVSAAKDIGRRLGVYMNGDATAHVAPIVSDKAPSQPAEKWTSGTPPENPPAPPIRGFDVVYTYRDTDGRAIRYVGRKNARDGARKLIIPVTWGSLDDKEGWHKRHPDAPRSLYGLDRLAAMQERTVVICEGEKAADAAQALLPEYPCITWSAGTANVTPNDWGPLTGRRVIIWPDNDGPGQKAAVAVRSALANIAQQVETLYVDDLPDGADAADINPTDPVAWLRDRLSPPEPPPHEVEYEDVGEPETPVLVEEGVIPLGHDRGIFYYYSRAGRQVFPVPAAGHSKNTLTAMASVAHFWQRSRHVGDKGNILWDDAIDWLMRECRAVGIYDPDRIRGRGAWIDNDRAVLHVGDRLIVDGKPCGLILPGSRYIYEAAKPLTTSYIQPICTADAHKLADICKAPNWKHGISGVLLAGFIVVAPVCGGLAWRPSIWITGGSGSGKSYLKENILGPAMGGMALLVQSKTTEAGIRQTLNCDARPVLFDEAEREDATAAARMQGVLDLLRQSSSEGGADIVKGSQSQTGARRYKIRSCFGLSSINVGIEHQADENRITVLALKDRDHGNAAEDEARFEEFNRTVQTTITADFAAGLLSRSVRLLPIIRANAETFARTISVVFGSRRTGDQLGALLAGAYALHSDRVISAEAAEAWVRKQDWGGAAASEVERDEFRLLSHLTQHRIRFSQGNSSNMEATIGRLLLAAAGRDTQINHDHADMELRQIGIRYDLRDGKYGIYVSTNHPALKRILVGTPWSAGWARAIGRLPNSITGEQKNIRFAFGHVGKACWVPMESIDVQADV